MPTADRSALGIAAILASTMAFPLSDLAAQSLMTSLPPLEVAWLRYVVFLLATLPLLARGRRSVTAVRPGLQLLRGGMAALSTLAAILSFKYLAVPETTAIGFVAPVMVTALAMIFLGEKVGIRRWSAAIAALIGVLIIVQPGGSSFRLAALIPLAGAVASAVAVIGTRLNKQDTASTSILYSALIGTVMLSALVVFDWTTPDPAQIKVVIAVGLFGGLGSLMQVVAYRFAPASLLAPFTYVQLLWASGLSFLFLGTVPTVGMVVGSAIIAASAIYTAYRERVKGVVA
ncbi:DMT family transporter [Lichenihabitans psoromatis]|uniref:DMT family transporter n=1 Tax=Lichenihabitans psoromatis TaxID=2528642 RepID=UPI0010385A84|nr:DMT family transporter [Lichenihabitans psoromatis]